MTAREFLDVLIASGVEFATGVPDSLLSDFLSQLDTHSAMRHIVAANEGSAMALAAGTYLATGQRALVYMQNSGLPNAINPYISMCHPSVYAIPSILVIGWRGEPGVPDEPQHEPMGEATERLLEILKVPVFRLRRDEPDARNRLKVWLSERRNETVAILVSAHVFDQSPRNIDHLDRRPLKRGDVLKSLVVHSDHEDTIFAGIGHIGRELLAARSKDGTLEEFAGDFLCVGGMGHVSQFALGFALSRPERRVWCLDGDGSFTMHMGACNWISRYPRQRFIHILFDNGVHTSTGGQEVCGRGIDYASIASTIGYKYVEKISSLSDAEAAIGASRLHDAPTFLWCLVDARSPTALPRPDMKLALRGEIFRSVHK